MFQTHNKFNMFSLINLNALLLLFLMVCIRTEIGVQAHGLNDLPQDCRNQTWKKSGGKLIVMSWHIHYTTNTTDQPRFYRAFVEQFRKYFPPSDEGDKCQFGPNYGNNTYPYVCSLEDAESYMIGVGKITSVVDGCCLTVKQGVHRGVFHRGRSSFQFSTSRRRGNGQKSTGDIWIYFDIQILAACMMIIGKRYICSCF